MLDLGIWDTGQWLPDNLIMDWYGHLLTEQCIADAFGYHYEFLDRRQETPRTAANSEEAVAARIRAEIDAGRPVIAIGIAGPEECLVSGYRESGKTLLVQSFFERVEGSLEVSDWYEEASFLGLHLFAKRAARKAERQNLMETLAWAVEMERMTEAAGLAAYEAWAQDMVRDEDLAGIDLEVLQCNCMSISDNGIILLMARQTAADYLEMMQDQAESRARQHLLSAAELHRQESKTV